MATYKNGIDLLKRIPIRPGDIQGVGRLTTDAIDGLVDLVEAVHQNIAHTGDSRTGMHGTSSLTRLRRMIPNLVYQTVRTVNGMVGDGLEAVFQQLTPMLENGNGLTSPGREMIVSVLNGILGDYLADTRNPLAIPMQIRSEGKPVGVKARDIAATLPSLNSKVLLMIHGLCMNDMQWRRQDHDHGAALAEALDYTPLYLHYNTGLHVSENGRLLSDLLETFFSQWPSPIDELVIVAHSMGGLVCRSACHYAGEHGHRWTEYLRKVVFLGTPHQGAWLERGGNWLNHVLGAIPYAAPFSRLGNVRSAGITDLRFGNVLDDDWADTDRFAVAADYRKPVPLPGNASCYAIAAATCGKSDFLGGWRVGDGLVSVNSALGYHDNADLKLPIPEASRWIGYNMHHMDLLSHPAVYQKLRYWLANSNKT